MLREQTGENQPTTPGEKEKALRKSQEWEQIHRSKSSPKSAPTLQTCGIQLDTFRQELSPSPATFEIFDDRPILLHFELHLLP